MASSSQRNVLVTGASGYIGSAVARAFIRAGWHVFGLIRRQEAAAELEAQDIVPILGSPDDLKWLPTLYERGTIWPVLVSVTENISDYLPPYTNIVTMLSEISKTSNSKGVRPLVLFTSGCKDYGRTGMADAPDLKPSTEDSPVTPPPFAVGRATHAVNIFQHKDLFDAALLRPTTVYGLTSSFYADAFMRAELAASENEPVVIPSRPVSIAHGCHVDDCGEAYVALAEHSDRGAVSGQCFNISGRRYETAREIADALVDEYRLVGMVYKPEIGTEDSKFANMLFAFSQWVDSEKIRALTEWTDKRPLFAEGLQQYRRDYELAKSQGNYAVLKTQTRLQSLK